MRLTAVCLALAILVSTGCHKVNSTDPVVISAANLANAEKVVNTIAHGLQAADQTLDSLQASDPEYYAAVEPKLKVLARLNETANQALIPALNGTNPNSPWKAAVLQIAAQAGNPSSLTAFGFKNPASAKKAQDGFKILISGLQLALQFQNAQ